MTVMQVPMEQMGREAARMLMQMSREGDRRIAGRFIPTSLLVRESFVAQSSTGGDVRQAGKPAPIHAPPSKPAPTKAAPTKSLSSKSTKKRS